MSDVIAAPMPGRPRGEAHLDLVPGADDAGTAAASLPRTDEAASPASLRRETITRLLCARIYLYGILGGIGSLHRLLGPPLRGVDPGIGYDRGMLLFHALQSTLLSLVFLAAALLVSYDGAFAWTDYDVWYYALIALVVVKIGLVNPWLARFFFHKDADPGRLRLPVLGRVAQAMCNALPGLIRPAACNTLYFKGHRPFLGYGTEINAWTLVIDTSLRTTGVETMAGSSREARPLTVDELYEAVRSGIERLGVSRLASGWRLFIDGCFARDLKRLAGGPLRRPPQCLPTEHVARIDREGVQGRRYLMLQSESPNQDLVATQFIRFAESGKLIFCEFASYVLSPGRRNLYWLDHMFQINPLVYAVLAPLPAAAAVVLAVLAYPFLYSLPHLELPEPLLDLSRYLESGYASDVTYLWSLHLWPYALPVLALLVVLGFLLVQAAQWIVTLVSIGLGLRRQFGLAFSYRERFATRGNLTYFELQEVIRFLKTQEKILLHSLLKVLREHDIDTTDLKDSVAAFINQGVINSGDIRGSVTSSVRSFLFRRPAKSVAQRRVRRAA